MPNRHISTSGNIPNLNAIRLLIVMMIAIGYASTMPLGPDKSEFFRQFGYDPSWIGVQLLFFYSGILALRSLRRHGSSYKYFMSRVLRSAPLLVIYTLLTVFAVYPIFGSLDGNMGEIIRKLGFYFASTVTCITPGQVLPGLLDDAKYMCLIQGAIWTFRWGLIAHIGVSLGNLLGLFNKNRVVLAFSVLALVIYAGLQQYIVMAQDFSFDSILPPLRLGAMFLVGMSVFAYQDRLPQSLAGRSIVLLAMIGFTGFSALAMPWTSLIEISLVLSWGWASYMLLTSNIGPIAWLQNWPNMVLALYLTMWPAAQLILLSFPNLGSWGLIMTSLPISLIISYIVYRLALRRFYKKAERFSGVSAQNKVYDDGGVKDGSDLSSPPHLSQA